MAGIWQDIRYAGRSLLKAPGFTSVVVLILAIGIGANVAMFGILNTAMIRPLPYPEPERLVLGRTTFSGFINPMSSAYDYWDWRDNSTSFERLAAFWAFTRNHTITGGERPERVPGIIASVELFPALGVSPALGRWFTPDEAQEDAGSVAIVSHGYWQRRFGGQPDVVGRTLIIDGNAQTVVGVMPAGFRFYFDVDIWRPMRPNSDYVGERRFHSWLILGRLKPGVTIEQAQSEVDVISAQLETEYPDSNRGKALLLTELQDALTEGYRHSLVMLVAAVALVLLIGCGNVAGLLLARGSARRAELSLRAVLGASPVRVIRQLLTESLLIAIAGGILGVFLAIAFQSFLIQFLSIDLPGMSGSGVSFTGLLFALLASLATGLLFGTVPALRAARGDLVEDLKSGVRTSDSGGTRFRSGLVVAQVAISLMLLVGAGLLIRSFASLRSVDPGFTAENLLTAEFALPESEYAEPEERIQFFTTLLENVTAIPGVEGVGLVNQLPVRDPKNNTYVYAADNPPLDPGDRLLAFTRIVLPGYFETMGIPLLAGRAIESSDMGGAPLVIVISQQMASTLFPGQDPLGRQVVIDFGQDVSFEIVGVVGDVLMNSLRGEARLAFYASYLQVPIATMRMAVQTSVKPASVAGALRDAVWRIDRNLPVADLATMDEVLARSVATNRIRAVALTAFAGVALLLAAVGLYGVLAYYVSRRRHEIGIRVALGADAAKIVALVLRRGIALVVIGIPLGLAGAFGVMRLLEGLLFQVEPTDPATFVAVSVLFALIGVFASLLPAWRALRVDPLVALQSE